jgi:hypothetical protein
MKIYTRGVEVVDILSGERFTVIEILGKDKHNNTEYLCRSLATGTEKKLKDYELVTFAEWQKMETKVL